MVLPLLSLLALAPLASTTPVSSNAATCQLIQSKVSSASLVSYPGSSAYSSDTHHWAPNAAQNSTCTVEPGSVNDVSTILRILSSVETPFAVKGGGRAGNQNFSSTTGVLIALSRLDAIIYNKTTKLVQIGGGAIWDNVYSTLEPHGVNVVGSRISGLGVGFALGGGYSWLSNRHGLTMDNIVSFEVVLPSGVVVAASKSLLPDLFWGLKGGLNTFGIVTSFVMTTVPQGQTWGGLIAYPPSSVPAVIEAVADWTQHNEDLDAVIVASFVGAAETLSATILTFYNGPEPPNPGPFSKLTAIPQSGNTTATGTFLETVIANSVPYLNSGNQRGHYSSARIGNITKEVIEVAINETVAQTTTRSFAPDTVVIAAMEPQLPNNILRPTSDSAWPHDTFLTLVTLNYFWTEAADDDLAYAGVSELTAVVNATAAAQHDTSNIHVNPNFSLGTVPLESIYGANLPRLRQIAAKYDPDRVMARSGGFVIQS